MDKNNDSQYAGYKRLPDVSARCFNYVTVYSKGIWNDLRPSPLQHHLLRFHAQLVVIVFLTSFFHFFFKRIHLPRISSEILTGILLGPAFFEHFFERQSRALFPRAPDIVTSSLVKVGYTLFTFTAGVRMDLSLISRMGKEAWILGLMTLFIPFTIMLTMDVKSPPEFGKNNLNAMGFIRIYYAAITTSQFVGVSHILMQLKITNSRIGHLALASTMISELVRFISGALFAYVNGYFLISHLIGIQMILLSTLFILGIMYPLKYLSLWFIRITPEDKPTKEIYTTWIVVIVLILAAAGDSVGLFSVFGPFLFGLIVPASSPLATNLLKKLETMVLGLLMPLLATFCAMKFDLLSFIQEFPHQDLLFKVSLAGFILKLIGTYITAIACKLDPKDAAAYTLIINIKGVLEVGIFLSYAPIENRDVETTSGIFLIFLLASIVTPLTKFMYDPTKQYIGHKKKSIEKASNDVELQMVACAHKAEDAIAAIKLLEYSNPTKTSPIVIYGLCLEELLSSATPVWIDHELGQKTNEYQGSRSQRIIDVFKYFKSQHDKLINVHVYTAISPLKQMYEDICRLSFEKAASLAIVPFHKKWNNKGKLLSANADIRELNINILKRAPCSIGILIDRPKDGGFTCLFAASSIYRVCVVFIGGSDDREALAFALRMAGSGRIQLTIMHFTVPETDKPNNWEAILDSEMLRRMKDTRSRDNLNINYMEESVRDGSETATILLSVQDHFDLFIVGRSHDTNPDAVSGLLDWAELSELGPIGDLLASKDITYPVSVLVVQQQIMKASHSSVLN